MRSRLRRPADWSLGKGDSIELTAFSQFFFLRKDHNSSKCQAPKEGEEARFRVASEAAEIRTHNIFTCPEASNERTSHTLSPEARREW